MQVKNLNVGSVTRTARTIMENALFFLAVKEAFSLSTRKQLSEEDKLFFKI